MLCSRWSLNPVIRAACSLLDIHTSLLPTWLLIRYACSWRTHVYAACVIGCETRASNSGVWVKLKHFRTLPSHFPKGYVVKTRTLLIYSAKTNTRAFRETISTNTLKFLIRRPKCHLKPAEHIFSGRKFFHTVAIFAFVSAVFQKICYCVRTLWYFHMGKLERATNFTCL